MPPKTLALENGANLPPNLNKVGRFVPLRGSLDPETFPAPDLVETKLAAAGASPEQVETFLWLLDFAQTQHMLNFTRLGKEVGMNGTTISRIFRGAYGAGLDKVCAHVAHFRELWAERQDWGQEPYVADLSVVRRIENFCQLVRASNQIGVIWGRNQSGKSAALEHVAKKHPMTAYAKLPAGGAAKESMKVIARARGGISVRKSYEDLRSQLLQRFNKLWLLLIDEFHQTLITRQFRMITVERVREFYDDCKTPVVLCGTPIVEEMFDDPRYKDFLGQISNRGVLKMHIPPVPTKRDIELLIEAYGFTHSPTAESDKHIKRIANENGIGQLTKYFRVARQLAAKSHERVAWKHFLTTHDTLSSWKKGEFENNNKK